MKMASDILCKKYIVQTIVNPATFHVLEYGKEISNETKLYISQRDVKTFKQLEDMSIGQIVAVKYEGRFHRGLITDIYNRCLKPLYHIWLVDNGCNIEISADSIFSFKTSELRNKRPNTTEVVVRGIQPVTIELLVSSVDLDDNMNETDVAGILHKRESNNWSPAAFKFIENLFKTNRYIFVKCIDINAATIIGDVYYKEEGVDKLISLAQTLCDKDFAIFSKSASQILPVYQYQGERYVNSIERRIPSIPQNLEWEELSLMNFKPRRSRNQFMSGNLSIYSRSDKSSSSDSDKFINNSEDKASALETGSFSPSWILKKMGEFSQSISSESFKSSCQNLEQTEKTLPSRKISLFRIVQRNAELYDKCKLKP